MKSTVRWSVARIADGTCDTVPDDLVVEEPLEVWVDDMPYAVLMRVPGDDLDLARGFCLTEGLVADAAGLAGVARCPEEEGRNRVLVRLVPPRRGESSMPREAQRASEAPASGADLGSLRVRVSRSSCGLCGRQRVEEILADLPPVEARSTLSYETIQSLRDDFEAAQRLFSATGGTHGAALYDGAGRRLAAAEDIGRHNALDKAIGALLQEDALEAAVVGVVSSRLSFEMVQKAVAARLEVLAGVSAATSLAAELADSLGITLVGFLREDRMNIYAHPVRLGVSPARAR